MNRGAGFSNLGVVWLTFSPSLIASDAQQSDTEGEIKWNFNFSIDLDARQEVC
jgi:hypothetical protein